MEDVMALKDMSPGHEVRRPFRRIMRIFWIGEIHFIRNIVTQNCRHRDSLLFCWAFIPAQTAGMKP